MENKKSYFDETSYASKKTLESFYRKIKLMKSNVDSIESLVTEIKEQDIEEKKDLL